ncbi:hypothetical protein NKR23_g3292 [Pleurostoma richardsiae]|uniref:Uncharacterized protein n=1 Tax=Pleurostoma richardsiae TaxID=41990 RepID=A0AA38RMZ6_9PEZI|nr:hypothetical protein NKR23_g3292 [Pleurostoma richardsiae]
MSSSSTVTPGLAAQSEAQAMGERKDDQQSSFAPTGAGVDTGAGSARAKTEQEKEADRLYEERIEDEYAKREGGA